MKTGTNTHKDDTSANTHTRTQNTSTHAHTHLKIRPDCLRQVGLVDHQEIGLGDARPSLPGNLVPPRDVDDVDDIVCQLSAVVGRQVVCGNDRGRKGVVGREPQGNGCLSRSEEVCSTGTKLRADAKDGKGKREKKQRERVGNAMWRRRREIIRTENRR